MKLLFWYNSARSTVYCRITVRGVRAEISTGIRIPPDQWDSVRQMVKNDKHAEIRIAEMRVFFRRHELIWDFHSAQSIKRAWEERNHKFAKETPSLIEVCPKGASKPYFALRQHLKKFLRRRGLRLDELDQEWADKFARYLVGKVSGSSAKLYITKLRAVLNQAIHQYPKGAKYPNMIEKIPFKGPEVLTQPSDKEYRQRYLTLKQYEDLKALKLDEKDTFYRNCFMFQCETGMAMADMRKFSVYDMHTAMTIPHGSAKYIEYKRLKTGVTATIPVTPEILHVLFDLGNWEEVRKLKERTYNRALRKLGEQVSFKRMTSHVGRHTFGVLRLIDGYSMEVVRTMLGHSSIKMTEQVYAKVTTDKIFKEKREIHGHNKN